MAGRTARSRGQVQAVLFLGGIVFMLLVALAVLRPDSTPEPERLLQQALLQLERDQEYTVNIEENAPGYALTFQGKVESGAIISGTLPEYNLEVFHVGEDLHVRKIGAEEWEDAQEIKSLSGFLVSPLKLLQAQKLYFKHAAEGQTVSLDGKQCRTVYLDLTGQEQFIKTLFPQIDTGSIATASLGAAFTEDPLSILQLRVLVEFADAGRLERAYHLN